MNLENIVINESISTERQTTRRSFIKTVIASLILSFGITGCKEKSEDPIIPIPAQYDTLVAYSPSSAESYDIEIRLKEGNDGILRKIPLAHIANGNIKLGDITHYFATCKHKVIKPVVPGPPAWSTSTNLKIGDYLVCKNNTTNDIKLFQFKQFEVDVDESGTINTYTLEQFFQKAAPLPTANIKKSRTFFTEPGSSQDIVIEHDVSNAQQMSSGGKTHIYDGSKTEFSFAYNFFIDSNKIAGKTALQANQTQKDFPKVVGPSVDYSGVTADDLIVVGNIHGDSVMDFDPEKIIANPPNITLASLTAAKLHKAQPTVNNAGVIQYKTRLTLNPLGSSIDIVLTYNGTFLDIALQDNAGQALQLIDSSTTANGSIGYIDANHTVRVEKTASSFGNFETIISNIRK